MKNNIGTADRISRYIFGILIAISGIYFRSWWGLLAIVPFITATLQWCPAYLPFGISTCKTKEK